MGPLLLWNPRSCGCSARIESLRGCSSLAFPVLPSQTRRDNFEFLPTDSDFSKVGIVFVQRLNVLALCSPSLCCLASIFSHVIIWFLIALCLSVVSLT